METKNIVIILLFIIPGKIFQGISYLLDMPQNEKQNEFSQIINGVMLSLPIIVITLSFFEYGCKFKTIDDLTMAFKDINFTLIFCFWLLFNSVVGGALFGIFKDDLYKHLNWFRKNRLKRLGINNKSCWTELLLCSYRQHYVDVIYNGVTTSGFVDICSVPSEDKEIILSPYIISEEEKNISMILIESILTLTKI